jgi:hypothetical protein
MKIVLKVSVDKTDYTETHKLIIDEKEYEYIYSLSECPEDAIIGRDLIDGGDIIKYIKMGFEAAKAGEELDIQTVEVTE